MKKTTWALLVMGVVGVMGGAVFLIWITLRQDVHTQAVDIPPAKITQERGDFLDISKLEVLNDEFAGSVHLADLNGDKHLDLLLLHQSSDFCGSGGCLLMIFKNTGTGFEYVNSIGTIRSVYLGTTTTNGWRDIVVGYSGGGGPSGYTQFQFNGRVYPGSSGSVGPAASIDGLKEVLHDY